MVLMETEEVMWHLSLVQKELTGEVGYRLVFYSVCLVYTKPFAQSPAAYNPGLAAHNSDPRTWDVEAGGSKVILNYIVRLKPVWNMSKYMKPCQREGVRRRGGGNKNPSWKQVEKQYLLTY